MDLGWQVVAKKSHVVPMTCTPDLAMEALFARSEAASRNAIFVARKNLEMRRESLRTINEFRMQIEAITRSIGVSGDFAAERREHNLSNSFAPAKLTTFWARTMALDQPSLNRRQRSVARAGAFAA